MFLKNSGQRLLYIFFFTLFFNWRIIALQYYVGFYQTLTWISHRFTMFPTTWISFPPSSPSYSAAAAKSLQSCPTLCNPIDGSPPGSPIPGILQARTLEWVAISFSNAWKWKVKVKSLSRVQLLATPWTAAHRAPPFPTLLSCYKAPVWIPWVIQQIPIGCLFYIQ